MTSLGDFFQFFADNYQGIMVFLVLLFAMILAISWLAQIFGWGRYRAKFLADSKPQDRLSYLVAEFFANIINDFRHLLALVIVLIFLVLIVYAANMGGDFDEKKEAIQLVLASLGGLLAAIIGYYFGESAATKANTAFLSGEISASATQADNRPNVQRKAPENKQEENEAQSRGIGAGDSAEGSNDDDIMPVAPPDDLK